jgi:acetylornithine deacetylase/succinyl-diaminopimelate desuccinylase-like protein
MRSEPAIIDRSHPAMEAAVNAYRAGFGAAPVFIRSGGSIPVVEMFKRILGIPTVLMGFASPDDRIHAPNERFSLNNYFRGIDTSIHFLAEAGRVLGRRRAENNGSHREGR